MVVENINGCTDTIVSNVEVFDNPVAGFSTSLSCAGGMTTFTDESTPADGELEYWLWDFGDGSTSIQQNPTHVYASAGTYQVMLWVGDTNDCFNQASAVVTVNPMPMAAFTHSGQGCLARMPSWPVSSQSSWVRWGAIGASIRINPSRQVSR
mgnify:CR=1 FL=1